MPGLVIIIKFGMLSQFSALEFLNKSLSGLVVFSLQDAERFFYPLDRIFTHSQLPIKRYLVFISMHNQPPHFELSVVQLNEKNKSKQDT